MARPTKEEIKKRDAAKQKVVDLFGGSVKVDIKDITKVVDKIDEMQSGGDNSWLSNQVSELGEKNKELENEILRVKDDYTKLFESKGGESEKGTSVNPNELERGIKGIFDDMRNNYEGNNNTHTKYEDAKIHVLLDKFLRSFPFLLEGKK